MTPNDDETARRGREALREYRELEAAFDKCRATIIAKMMKAPVGNDEVLRLHAAAQGLDMVQQALRMMASHGVMAEEALERAARDQQAALGA